MLGPPTSTLSINTIISGTIPYMRHNTIHIETDYRLQRVSSHLSAGSVVREFSYLGLRLGLGLGLGLVRVLGLGLGLGLVHVRIRVRFRVRVRVRVRVSSCEIQVNPRTTEPADS